MSSTKKIIFALALAAIVLIPATLALADSGGFVGFPYWPSDSTPLLPCFGTGCVDLCQFIVLLQRVFYFILTLGVFGLAPVMIAIGGLMVLLGGASQNIISTGKKVLTGTIIGIVFALLAWIIVSVLITVMNASTYIGGFPGGGSICPYATIPSSALNFIHPLAFMVK